MAEATQKKGRGLLPPVVSFIAIAGFIGTLLAYSFNEGKSADDMIHLQDRVERVESENKIIKQELIDQNVAINNVNSKLDLLLNHFNITSSGD